MIRRLSPIVLLSLATLASAQPAPTSQPAVDAPRWSFDLSHAEVRQAWIADDAIYLDLPSAVRNGHDGFDPTPTLAPLTYPNKEGYGDGPAIAAIDRATGTLRWCRPYLGEFRFALDPDGRDLWAFAGTIHRLDAMTGRSTVELPFEVAGNATVAGKSDARLFRTVFGIRRDGKPAVTRMDDPSLVWNSVRVYDVDAKAIVDAFVASRSPNKLARIESEADQSPTLVRTHVQAVPINGGNAIWRYTTPGYSGNRPVALGGDLLVLSGQQTTMASVARIDAASGAVRWSLRLPRGAYVATRTQHRDGTYGPDWSAVGVLDAHTVFAIGGDGDVFVIDAETGQIRATIPTEAVHHCAPRLIGDQLIVVNEDRIRCLPFDAAISRAEPADVAASLDRARDAIRAGHADQAMDVANVIVDQMPGDRDAWAVLAKAARYCDEDADATRAAVRWLDLGDEVTEPWLQKDFGLLARIDTGAMLAPLADIGLFLYAPSIDGQLYVIDPTTLRVIEKRPMTGDAESAKIRAGQFVRRGDDRVVETLLATADATLPPTRDDPLFSPFDRFQPGGWMGDQFGPLAQKSSPPEEFMKDTRGETRDVGDRKFRAVPGGGTRELRDGDVISHLPVFDGASDWAIQATSAGPIGVGVGGCYALDESLRPTRFLVDLRDRPTEFGLPSVEAVERDGDTLVVVSRDPKDSSVRTLRIYAADGKRMIREIRTLPTGRGDNLENENARLFKLGDGYFYAGGELLWLPMDPKKKPWRFCANEWPTPGVPDAMLDHSFGVTRIRDGKLFVACHRGGVFVFDVARITK